MSSPDPISLVYDAIWAIAESSSRLTALVRLKNRIKYNSVSSADPHKYEISAADLPELALVINSLSANIGQTSSSSHIKLQLDWWISTGDPRVTKSLGPIMWAVLCAMTPWVNTAVTLTWKGKTFVKNVALLDANLGFTDAEKNRGIDGWSAVWGCEVSMNFATADLEINANEAP